MCTPSTEWGFPLFCCCTLLLSSWEVDCADVVRTLSGAYDIRGVERITELFLLLPGDSSIGTRMLIARGCWWREYRPCLLSLKILSSACWSPFTAGDRALAITRFCSKTVWHATQNLSNYRIIEGSSDPSNNSLPVWFNGFRVMRHDSSWSYESTGCFEENVLVSLRTPL